MLTQPTDPPRVICAAEGCDNELQADRRHVDNLLDAGWRCAEHREETR